MHLENPSNPNSFEFRCIRLFKKPLETNCFEGVFINWSKADIRPNSKAELNQSSKLSMLMTRISE